MVALVGLFILVGAVIYRAWLASIAWSWVAVERFDFPEIGVALMAAVIYTLSLVQSSVKLTPPNGRSDAENAFGAFVGPAVWLAMVWIALKFA